MLVNSSIPSLPIVFVSNEFTSFYRYARDDVYLKDARLEFMIGPKTKKKIMREIKYTLETSNENTLSHVLYTKDGIPIHTQIGLLKVKKSEHGSKDCYFAITFDPFKDKHRNSEGISYNVVILSCKSVLLIFLFFKMLILKENFIVSSVTKLWLLQY